MSHEGGPESTQQRTVAELLAMYGGDAGERAPRRRRRRDDPAETGPQAIIERVNSESAKLQPIRDDQPPPTRTSHRQHTGTHQPVPPPQPAEQRPAQQRPVAPPPRPAQQPPQRQAPRPVPQQAPAPPPPLPAQTTQFPGITSPEPTRPVPPPRPQRRAAPQPPPQSMPSGSFPRPDAPPPQGSGYFPAPAPPPPVRQNGAPPEASTEQLPRVPQQPPAGRNSTGSHPVPSFPPTRSGFGPAGPGAPPAAFNQEPVTSIEQRLTQEDYPGPDADEFGAAGAADFQDYREDDDLDEDAYDEDLDEDAPSAGREWLIMAGQVAISVIGGAAVWLGFNWLWGRYPQAALVAALVVIVGLVWIVRKIRRADDLQTMVLAVLVGLFVTVSPAALLLLGR